MTSITKNDNSRPHKIFNRKKMLNRFYFPPTLPHSTHIRLWCRAGYPTGPLSKKRQLRPTGEPTHDLHHQERQLRPSQNIQQKKDVKSILFPTYPPAFHPHSFVVPGRISNLGPSIKIKRQLRPSQNIQKKKKDVKSIIFPNQTFRILPTFICGAGPENQHMTSITKNDNSSPHKIFNRKKMLNRFYFPPTLPHSTHIRLWCRAGYPT
ncbi:hypothetical protein TNCV_456551 [Trichonephila clavipes]|uniref:Uncharacterized protein n=1 Tax=Trichonephila clavipes TaxID=2585209 RepID=A0A8X6RUJ9_TRICX|nr:hypothetical protein TNCV_456551 [Trichonephila clavipes]